MAESGADMPNMMQLAIDARLTALEIVQDALNEARREIRKQVFGGRINRRVIAVLDDQDGFAPTKIDAHIDGFLAREVHKRDANSIYWSEETKSNIAPNEGDIFAWADPIDGTTNAFTFFGAYAVVLFYETFRNGAFHHLGGAIASSTGEVVSWQHFMGKGEVWVDWPAPFEWPGTGDHAPAARVSAEEPKFGGQVGGDGTLRLYGGLPSRLATVATTLDRRHDLAMLMDIDAPEPEDTSKEDKRWFSTLGGNPLAVPLMLGQLGAIVEPHTVKLHDAAYLIPLTLAGGLVIDLNDTEINIFKIAAESDPRKRIVPPFIATADTQREATVKYVAELRKARISSRKTSAIPTS